MIYNKIKLATSFSEGILGVYWHPAEKVLIDEENNTEESSQVTRLIIGLLIFQWEIIW